MSDRGEMLRRAAEAKRRLEEVRKQQEREKRAKEDEVKLKAKAIADARPTCDQCSYRPKNYSDYVAHMKKKHPDGER